MSTGRTARIEANAEGRNFVVGDVHGELHTPKWCSSCSGSTGRPGRRRRPKTSKSGRTRVNGVGTNHTEYPLERVETEISEEDRQGWRKWWTSLRFGASHEDYPEHHW